jgi:hypothetical protein
MSSNDDGRDADVYLAPSTVCEGTGVFARRRFRGGDTVTAYAGARYSPSAFSKRPKRTDFEAGDDDFQYQCEDGFTIDGKRKGRVWWTKEGFAQFSNDAIHPELTGKTNNCVFVEKVVDVTHSTEIDGEATCTKTKKRRRVFLLADRDIDQDEELLVAYGLGYWLSWGAKQKRNDEKEGADRRGLKPLRDWMDLHARVQKHVIRPAFCLDVTSSTSSSSCCRIRELVRHSTTPTDPRRYPELYGIPRSTMTSRYVVEYKHPATLPRCGCERAVATGKGKSDDGFVLTYVDVRVEECEKRGRGGEESVVSWWNAEAACAECGMCVHRVCKQLVHPPPAISSNGGGDVVDD